MSRSRFARSCSPLYAILDRPLMEMPTEESFETMVR